MKRLELIPHMERIDVLAREMQEHLPLSLKGVEDLRADLAGLLVVTIIASYESCVKETLVSYAFKQSDKFSEYVERRYNKLNSKIAINDLSRYCTDFAPNSQIKFKNNFKRRKDRVNNFLGQNIERKYEQLLEWRHDFAHKAVRNTTIEEAIDFHRYAKHVLFSFYDSFHA